MVTKEVKTELSKALENLGNVIKDLTKSGFNKLRDALSFFTKIYNKAKLYLIENMFGFIDEVVKLAKKKKWDVSHINMVMPEIGIDFAELKVPIIGRIIKLPLPNVTQPKVTVTFTLSQ